MTTTCNVCGVSWTGRKLEHCTQCHRTFSSTRAGDLHEVGPFAPKPGEEPRRCRTEEEMLAVGLAPRTLTNGVVVWGRAGRKPSF